MEACSKRMQSLEMELIWGHTVELLRIDGRNLVNEKSHKIFN